MNLSGASVTIFGGTGFVGKQIIRALAKQGAVIRVACRMPEKAYALRTAGGVGQIVPVACDVTDAASLRQVVEGSAIVINCIGLLFEKGHNNFQALHVDFPQKLARVCTEAGVQRFVHISALGIEAAQSDYAKTKYAGEKAVRALYPAASFLRPSVIFGPEDNFFNQFATLARYLPFLPLIGGGTTKLQPVFVGDVADAVIAVLQQENAQGQIYELGGPEILNFKDIYARLFRYTQQPRPLMPIPFTLAKLQGAVLQMLPKPLLTIDQVRSLATDSIVTGAYKTIQDLGLTPTTLDAILPTYLDRFCPGGRFANKKRA